MFAEGGEPKHCTGQAHRLATTGEDTQQATVGSLGLLGEDVGKSSWEV